MGMNELRKQHRAELDEMCLAIQPNKNCEIASRAIEIALFWISKAENQAVQIRNLEEKNKQKCEYCDFYKQAMREDSDYDW